MLSTNWLWTCRLPAITNDIPCPSRGSQRSCGHPLSKSGSSWGSFLFFFVQSMQSSSVCVHRMARGCCGHHRSTCCAFLFPFFDHYMWWSLLLSMLLLSFMAWLWNTKRINSCQYDRWQHRVNRFWYICRAAKKCQDVASQIIENIHLCHKNTQYTSAW